MHLKRPETTAEAAERRSQGDASFPDAVSEKDGIWIELGYMQ